MSTRQLLQLAFVPISSTERNCAPFSPLIASSRMASMMFPISVKRHAWFVGPSRSVAQWGTILLGLAADRVESHRSIGSGRAERHSRKDATWQQASVIDMSDGRIAMNSVMSRRRALGIACAMVSLGLGCSAMFPQNQRPKRRLRRPIAATKRFNCLTWRLNAETRRGHHTRYADTVRNALLG
jgi:hypothetical protein